MSVNHRDPITGILTPIAGNNTPLDVGTAAFKDFSDVVRAGDHRLVESNAVANSINQALSSIYTPRGDIACADLTSALLIEANIGNVYETSDAGTTSALFIQGADHPIVRGDNVGIIKAGQNAIMFNLMGNAFDLHDYQKKELDTPLMIGGVSRTTVESALGALNTPHEVIVATSVASGSKTFKDALYELLPTYRNFTTEQRVNSYLRRGDAKYTFISGNANGAIYSHIHVQGTDLLVARTMGLGSNSQGNDCWYREAQARTAGLSFPDYSSTIMSGVDMYLCYSY